MAEAKHTVEITIDRLVFREVGGESWLVIRDSEGHTYQQRNWFQVSRRGQLSPEAEAILLLRPGDQAAITFTSIEHGPLNLYEARVIQEITPFS